jgi:hypothetical protein
MDLCVNPAFLRCVRIELTGAHAERIVRFVRFVLGQLGGARC